MSTTEKRSSHNRNKHLTEALTTEMGQIFDIHLNQIRQGHHKARKRKEQELKSKPPDNSLRSIQSSPQKITHTPKSKSVFHYDYKPTNALFKFSGKQDYLEWEKNMDEWFSYKNFLSEMRFVCALSHLTGDAYKWWLQEVDDRLYYKEPPITLWRDLKKLLRNKYAPQALECTPKGNPKIQGLAAQEKEQGLAPYSKKNPISEQQLKDEILKILNAYNKPKKVKSTSQPKMVTEEVVVHKQNRQPSLASSGEQKQCKSSNLSKSRGVTCYNCRKKGHLVATCPEKFELTNTSLESKLSSPNSSSEVVSQGLENSSSCVMHLFLSKDVDSGHTMEHENDKTEGSTKEENHHLVSTTSQACRADYVSKITILNMKGPPYVSQPVLNRELPKQEPCELGGFTQVEAVMVHKQSPRAECNIFFKDKPPDATPPIKTRGIYLNSQNRMKANLLSLGEGCTLWGAIKKTNDREISTHHMSQSRDPREDYQNQLRLKHMEECIEEPEMDISSFSTFHTYQWRPGELLDSSREEELVTNNALIQKEPPDPTPLPLVMMIPSTEHTVNLTQETLRKSWIYLKNIWNQTLVLG
ncbi:putative transcription factor interactor and regulator CCHC(Zn) family [Arabidopsis thaliana]